MIHKQESWEKSDFVINNGQIIDGTGSPGYYADVRIRGGRITDIGMVSRQGSQVIDAGGMVVAPGFIDMLGQSELSILVNPHLPSKIFQGITTEFTGEGGSVAPLSELLIEKDRTIFDKLQIAPDWTSFREYFDRLERQGIGINLGSYVGATQVRRMVLGDDNRAPTNSELERMKTMVRQGMLDGAVGLSTALQYAPGMYASTQELIALATESSQLGGIYATHLRSEGNAIRDALSEAIQIGQQASMPVEIWHLKAAGKANWGRMPEIVLQIEEARASGVDITADTYAYPAWFNTLSSFTPPWARDGGSAQLIERLRDREIRERIKAEMRTSSTDWDNQWKSLDDPNLITLAVVHNPDLQPLQGKTIVEIAKIWAKEPIDTILDLLIQDGARAYIAAFGMSESDIVRALRQPWVSICTDSRGTAPDGLLGKDHPHPRAYGTYARILRKYVREEKILSLEEAIRKFTALPAQRMQLSDRGIVKPGMWADVVIFDPRTVSDLASFEAPNQLSTGMEYVLVNGVPVIHKGQATQALPGKTIRGAASVDPSVETGGLRRTPHENKALETPPKHN